MKGKMFRKIHNSLAGIIVMLGEEIKCTSTQTLNSNEFNYNNA